VDRVAAWFVDSGQAELNRLTAAIDGVHTADTPGASYAGLDAACATFAAAVASARDGPRVPDAAEETSFSSALAEYAASATDCRAGASAHDVTLINKAGAAMSAGTSDLAQFTADTRAARVAAARNCKQQYQAWTNGPAHAPLGQLLTALKTLQRVDSGTSLPAIAAAIKDAAQSAAELARYPAPACADSRRDFAAILARVRSAAASAVGAKSLSAMTQALAPMNAVPALESAFTAEVKLATGA
jgi:hypothetical protein